LLLLLLLALLAAPARPQNTDWLNSCNGHGTFSASTKRCTCYEGWGAPTDVSAFKHPACLNRICPAGASWAALPTATTAAHPVRECSDQGTCERGSGECVCFDGFAGRACDRLACPRRCSGHGDCMSIRQLATLAQGSAYPLTASPQSYAGAEATTTWDQDKSFGCLCHSSWPVGLANAQSQLGEWFGPDCASRRCPSGNDPSTSADETDCEGKSDNGASTASPNGAAGNKCHVECSNRGVCNHKIGVCACFAGYHGNACDFIETILPLGAA